MAKSKANCFLIDGFPRAVDQGQAFERAVCESTAVIFYDCPEDTLEKRLLKRGKSSGRVDDNVDSIRKRFKTFVDTTLPVIDYYRQNGVVRVIDSQACPETVFTESCRVIDQLLTLKN
jgi:UMP-CMP kinase